MSTAPGPLGTALRAWRDRLTPAEVGLPAGGRRRSPGLRREELAQLSGVSVDYVVRLEQGRSRHPSPQVVAALARALRLSSSERDALHVAAGVAPVSPDVVPAHLSPGLQRMLDRLQDTAVAVFTAAWDLLAGNALWDGLFGDHTLQTGRERNLAWRHFTAMPTPVRHDAGTDRYARALVTDLRAAVSRYPRDRALGALVADLRTTSDRFATLWDSAPAEAHAAETKTVLSATVGSVRVDCDVLTAPDADLRLVVYTARPGSADETALALLRVTGLPGDEMAVPTSTPQP